MGVTFNDGTRTKEQHLILGAISIADSMNAPSTLNQIQQAQRPSSANGPQGPAQFFIDGSFRDVFIEHAVEWAKTKWFLSHPYQYKASRYRNVLNPSPGQILEILNACRITFHQLYPNAVANLITFVAMCNMLNLPKTLTLLKNIFKLVAASTKCMLPRVPSSEKFSNEP